MSRPYWLIDTAIATLPYAAIAVDEEVVPDVVPAACVHVIVLNGPNDSRDLRSRIVVRPRSVVNDGTAYFPVADFVRRGSRIPRVTKPNTRLRNGRCEYGDQSWRFASTEPKGGGVKLRTLGDCGSG